MKVKITTNYNADTVYDVNDQNQLLKHIGQCFLEEFQTNKNQTKIFVQVTDEDYNSEIIGEFEFSKRGTFLDKGIRYPSMHCSRQFFNSKNLPFKPYKQKELRCINLEGNNYKKYLLLPVKSSVDSLFVKYGSIDVNSSECRTVEYQNYMYWILYYEKLSKGYKDFSSVLVSKAENKSVVQKSQIENEDDELYNLLLKFSKNFTQEVLVNDVITKKLAEKIRKLFTELQSKKTIKGFNTALSKLMVLSPRKRNPMAGDKIIDYCARSKEDFEKILNFEEALCNSIEAVACDNQEEKTEIQVINNFAKMGIEISKPSIKELDEVKSYLGYTYSRKLLKVFKINHKAQELKFNNYCKKNNITKIRKFFHGSINQNWFSILVNGLRIGKVANGRMFGDGVYFASSADKSFGYTSYYGSRWAGGNSNIAIMGLYSTAYGKPFFPHTWGHNFNQEFLKQNNCNCLHATPANTGLRAEEIIFYDTDATKLDYICLFN